MMDSDAEGTPSEFFDYFKVFGLVVNYSLGYCDISKFNGLI